MHRRNQTKLPNMMSLAFQHHNVCQVRKFKTFKQEMVHSLCLQRARVLLGFAPFVNNRTPGEDINGIHNFLKQNIIMEGVSTELSPCNQKYIHLPFETVSSALINNEDRTVLMCWNPSVKTGDDGGSAAGASASRGWRAKELRCRHIRNMQTMMLTPLIMTWSFEQSSTKMKAILKELKQTYSWYEQENNPNSGLGTALDQRACRALLGCLEMVESVGTFLSSATKTKKTNKTKTNNNATDILQHVESLNNRAQEMKEIGTKYVEIMAMDGGKTNCLEPASVGLLSRFVRVDAIVIALLLHSLHRSLPPELLKASKKKSKKSKKSKGKKGGKNNTTSKHELDGLRVGIVALGTALHDVLCLVKKTMKHLLPKVSEVDQMGMHLFGAANEQGGWMMMPKTMKTIVALQRQEFVSKQLLEDWHASFESLSKIIDDRVQVLLRLPGVG